MDVNLPVWDYYPKDDSFFLDPMYVPYVNRLQYTNPSVTNSSCISSESTCNTSQVCPQNNWKKQGYADGFVNPALVRKGWGLDFMLMHPDKDPCPEGWTKTNDGWCVANQPEFGNHGLYSNSAFIPRYQYWDGYAPRLRNPRFREISEFDNKSVNPFTGNYVVYTLAKPAENRSVYGHLASKDSYLA